MFERLMAPRPRGEGPPLVGAPMERVRASLKMASARTPDMKKLPILRVISCEELRQLLRSGWQRQ